MITEYLCHKCHTVITVETEKHVSSVPCPKCPYHMINLGDAKSATHKMVLYQAVLGGHEGFFFQGKWYRLESIT